MGKVIDIEDSTILTMLGDQKFLDLLPCFSKTASAIRRVKAGCGRCKKSERRKLSPILKDARNCLAGLPGSKRKELKRLLNCDQYVLIRPNAKGSLIRMKY